MMTSGINQLMLQRSWTSGWLRVVRSAGIAYNLSSETAN
jgi:hypothetical protein